MDIRVTSSIRNHEEEGLFLGNSPVISKTTFLCYINDILHFSLDITDNVRFVHAYTDKNMYHVDITTYNESMLQLEYDSKDKWEMVLKQLDRIL